jgi:hypothetical protein
VLFGNRLVCIGPWMFAGRDIYSLISINVDQRENRHITQ